uniref:Uncharacterized protein n=1 Tax=Caenorhabditis japonica TaxID=281687 RepID=A0A8R1IP42_CAEJA
MIAIISVFQYARSLVCSTASRAPKRSFAQLVGTAITPHNCRLCEPLHSLVTDRRSPSGPRNTRHHARSLSAPPLPPISMSLRHTERSRRTRHAYPPELL